MAEVAVIRVMLAQRRALTRGALAAVLSGEDDLRVVAELAHASDLVPTARREHVDVAVLDHDLPGGSVVSLCDMVLAGVPDCAVLVILDRRAIAAVGGDLAKLVPRVGVVATDASPETLVDGVRRLARGEPVLDVELAVAALTAARANPLTDREREVLRLARDGVPPREIAKRLYLSAGTVRNYLARIVAKMGARTRLEAIRIAQDAGWI